MKANELRIGNFVYLSDKGKVWEILDGHEIDECDDNPFSQPILLTEEWLFKFGFEEAENGWLRIEICENWGGLYWERLAGLRLSINSNVIQLPHIKYVHQLQNLYFELTGKELKYELE